MFVFLIFFSKMGDENWFEANHRDFNVDSLLQAYSLLIRALERFLGNKN